MLQALRPESSFCFAKEMQCVLQTPCLMGWWVSVAKGTHASVKGIVYVNPHNTQQAAAMASMLGLLVLFDLTRRASSFVRCCCDTHCTHGWCCHRSCCAHSDAIAACTAWLCQQHSTVLWTLWQRTDMMTVCYTQLLEWGFGMCRCSFYPHE
jgi:hypothetical protein